MELHAMEMDLGSSKRIIETLRKSPLFSSLASKQINELVSLFAIRHYNAHEIIINEHEVPSEFYIIQSGSVEVLKESIDKTQHRISLLQAGEVFGELGLLDNSPRSASIRALIPSTLLVASIADLKALAKELQQEAPVYFSLISNLAHLLNQRLRRTNEVTVASLKNELALSKARVAMGKFMINILLIIAVYMYAFRFIEKMARTDISTTIISLPLLLFFTTAIILTMKSSGYSMEFYGLTLKHWRQSLKDSVIVTFLLVIVIAFIKWLLITFIARYQHLSLIHFTVSDAHGKVDFPLLLLLLVVYLVFTPLQELICRGALQSSFQEFLTGRHRIGMAIIMSNVLFAGTHLFISFSLAVAVIIPGMAWGWMYARNKTLIGSCLSHLIVGGLAYFVFDVNSILEF